MLGQAVCLLLAVGKRSWRSAIQNHDGSLPWGEEGTAGAKQRDRRKLSLFLTLSHGISQPHEVVVT